MIQDPYNQLHEKLGNKNLKVANLIVNGLLSKFTEIQYILNTVKFDVLGIAETNLKENIKDDFIRIEGYSIARKDRVNKAGGGVILYYREDREDKHKDSFASNDKH